MVQASVTLREAALLVALALPLLFTGLGISFLDPDEGLYADVAQAMRAHGDLVMPRFNGLPYLEKPPLYFWMSALALAIGLPVEIALRGAAAVAALATALLTWRLGRDLYGREAGVLAGLAILTTAGVALFVRKASTDFVFVACLTLTLWGFVRDAERPERGSRRFLVMYLGAGLGLLAKGLIGLLFPALIVAIALVVRGGLSLRSLNLGRGLLVLTAVALPWHVAVAARSPELFWFYLVDNQVLRFLGRRAFLEDDVPVTTLGFILVTFVWLFPWGVFALARPCDGGVASAPAERWRLVTVIWGAVIVAFFAASRSKLEYYALPAFPAIAVRVGAAWAGGRDVGRWLWIGLAGCVVVGVAAIVAGGALSPAGALEGLAELNVYYRILRDQGRPFPFASAEPFGALLQALGVTLIAGWGATGLLWWWRRRRGAYGALFLTGAVIAMLIVRLLVLVEPHHSTRAVATALVRVAGADDVVVHEGPLEYSAALPLYAGRRVVVVNGTRGDLDSASRLPEGQGWFLTTAELERLWTGPRRVFLVSREPRAQSVIGMLPAATVDVIGQFGAHMLYANGRTGR